MKRLLLILTIFAMLSIILVSCKSDVSQESELASSQAEEMSEESINESASSEAESSSVSEENKVWTEVEEYYNPYYLLSENDPFIVAMKENPIDKYAEKVMKNNETTQDMMSGLYLVFDEWEKELHATEAKLKETIEDKTLKEAFVTSQESWTEYVNTSLACDKALITKNGWSTDIPLMFLSKRIEIYRERTFHLKYLMYLYSIDADDGVVEEAMTFYTCR